MSKNRSWAMIKELFGMELNLRHLNEVMNCVTQRPGRRTFKAEGSIYAKALR